MKRDAPDLLVHGFRLALRNWPCLAWAYAVNLGFALSTAIPFSAGLAGYLDHSLAARQIAGNLDAAYLGELAILMARDHITGPALENAYWLTLIETLVFVFLTASILSVYMNGHPPKPSLLLRGGAEFFWRLVRAGGLALLIAGPALALLLAARAWLLSRMAGVSESRNLWAAAVSAAAVLMAALALRLWFDLVEGCAVRNALSGERAVRRALLPALVLLRQRFLSAYGSFLAAGACGAAGLAACIYLWKNAVDANQVAAAFVIAQAGFFLLLAARLWQRGIGTVLVLAVYPLPAPERRAAETRAGGPSTLAQPPAPAVTREPTLQELVQKLHREPWASPETSKAARTDLFPEKTPAEIDQAGIDSADGDPAAGNRGAKEPQISLLAEHEMKPPLPRSTDAAAAPADSPAQPEGPEERPGSGLAATVSVNNAGPEPQDLQPAADLSPAGEDSSLRPSESQKG